MPPRHAPPTSRTLSRGSALGRMDHDTHKPQKTALAQARYQPPPEPLSARSPIYARLQALLYFCPGHLPSRERLLLQDCNNYACRRPGPARVTMRTAVRPATLHWVHGPQCSERNVFFVESGGRKRRYYTSVNWCRGTFGRLRLGSGASTFPTCRRGPLPPGLLNCCLPDWAGSTAVSSTVVVPHKLFESRRGAGRSQTWRHAVCRDGGNAAPFQFAASVVGLGGVWARGLPVRVSQPPASLCGPTGRTEGDLTR